MDSESTSPEAQTSSSLRSRASRIITVKHRSVFYPLVIFFVLANITLPFAVNCVLLGLLFAWLLLVVMHARNPAFLGARLGRSAGRTADRIRAFPPELLLILVIVYICIASKLPFPLEGTWLAERWAAIIYSLALVFGAAFDHLGGTRATRNGGLRNWLKARFSRRSVAEAGTQEVKNLEAAESEYLDSIELLNLMTEEEEAWHKAQQERWRTWIAEETERFRGELH